MIEPQALVRLLLLLYGDEAYFVATARAGQEARDRNAGAEWLWREVLRLLTGDTGTSAHC